MSPDPFKGVVKETTKNKKTGRLEEKKDVEFSFLGFKTSEDRFKIFL
jgi:hypothetical protein